MSGVAAIQSSGVQWMGDVPSHWSVMPLRFLVTCLDGIRVPLNATERGAMQGAVPYWGANTVVDYVNRHLIDGPLVLLGEDGAPFFDRNRPVAFAVNEPIWPNNHIHVLRPNEDVDHRFLAYALNIVDYVHYIDGATRDKLTQSNMMRIMVALPPLAEQHAIATYLDAETARIDGLIEAKRKLLESLIELKSVRITEILTGASNNLVRTGDVWLPRIPKGWTLKRLKHLGQVRSGLAKGKKHDAGTETLELPYMRVANVQDGHIDLSDVATLEVAADDVERYSLAVGDVLMNEGGDYDKLGRGAVWEGKVAPCLHQNHVFAVRLDDVAWAPWVSALTRTAYAKFYFMNNSKQSTNLASISQSNVKEWPVVMPPEDIRDKLLEQLIAELKRADDLIEHVELELKTLAELRAATITDAVLGRIDVREHMKN